MAPAGGRLTIGFVIPWFGPDIPGGAEAHCRATAVRLAAAGARVEILTTCVKDFTSDWSARTTTPPGVDDYRGLPVRRFGVRPRDAAAFDRVNHLLMSGLPVADADEQDFMREMVRSDDLVRYLEAHRREYVYVLLPYMFGTTYYGATACPDRSVLVPCLHDESYARMGVVRDLCRAVRGLIFNTRHEAGLAAALFGPPAGGAVVAGVGVDADFPADGDRFRATHRLTEYVLYAGRRDPGKNVPLLVDYFSRYKRAAGGDLKLVLIGNGGADGLPEYEGRDVIDLGFVGTQEKYDAYAGALVLCQPSAVESFSLVMMEAWAAGTPCLALEGCAVTRDHCLASSGGLYFSSAADFAGAVEFFLRNPGLRDRMGRNGRRYVRANFAWDRVAGKYLAALRGWGFDV